MPRNSLEGSGLEGSGKSDHHLKPHSWSRSVSSMISPTLFRIFLLMFRMQVDRLAMRTGLLFLIICLPGCRSEETSAPKSPADSVIVETEGQSLDLPVRANVVSVASFVDMTDRTSIRFQYKNDQEAGHYAILESLGGGVGLTDYDLDGNLDLFVPGGGAYQPEKKVVGLSPGLFRNHGQWSFSSHATEAGVDSAPFYSHGAAVGDIDNDGFSDVVVTGYGGLLLFQNLGDGTYREMAQDAGLTDTLWSTSAALGDVNGDGNPDLYVAHYVDWSMENNPVCGGPQPNQQDVCPPRKFEPLPDTFYQSNGDGSFSDVTSSIPLRPDGKGLGVLMADVDLDGHIDIYVANDTVPNFLYRNTGDGRLEDASSRSGTSLSDSGSPDGSMGVDVGDFNLDGRPDLWVSNFERESFALYRNDGDFFFQHVSRSTGVTAVGGLAVGWGTVFMDFDRDGDEDVFVSNGHVIRYPQNAPLRQPPLLFQNDSGRRFNNVAPMAGSYMKEPHMGRGVASGDLDNDGDFDLAISCTNEPLTLLANESGTNASLVIRLIGTEGSRDVVGAFARVRASQGQPQMLRQVKSAGSYASSSDSRLFFGVGKDQTVEEVEIHWPSGTVQTLKDVPVSKHLVLREPARGSENESE